MTKAELLNLALSAAHKRGGYEACMAVDPIFSVGKEPNLNVLELLTYDTDLILCKFRLHKMLSWHSLFMVYYSGGLSLSMHEAAMQAGSDPDQAYATLKDLALAYKEFAYRYIRKAGF